MSLGVTPEDLVAVHRTGLFDVRLSLDDAGLQAVSLYTVADRMV